MSVGTIVIVVAIFISLTLSFVIYKFDVDLNIKTLRGIIKTLEDIVADREKVINELHLIMMAKDLTDYRVNTKVAQENEFVQTEPTEVPIEQATDEQFLKAIKEAAVEPTEPVSQ